MDITALAASMPTVSAGVLCHVGALNPAMRREYSLEADFLSASDCPDAWEIIARLGGGDHVTISHDGALFIDACQVLEDKAAADRLFSALSGLGLMERKELWRAWRYDCESESWGYLVLPTREMAEAEVDDPEDGPSNEAVTSHEAMVLTDAGMALLPRLPDRHACSEDGALMLLCRLAGPDVVHGVYWDETLDPDALSAPRYAILPEALHLFEVDGPLGVMPFENYVQTASRLAAAPDAP